MTFQHQITKEKITAEIKKVSWWHESIVDVMLAEPDISNGELAARFQVSQSWMSTIKNSDAFRAYFQLRREAHAARVSTTVIERTEKLANLSLDVLQERIAKERDTIGLSGVLDTAKTTLQALGFGGHKPGGPGALANGTGGTVVNVQVNAGDLAQARAAMREVSANISIETKPNNSPHLVGAEVANGAGEPFQIEGTSREVSSASAA